MKCITDNVRGIDPDAAIEMFEAFYPAKPGGMGVQRMARLSQREVEILRHVASGQLNKQVAGELGIALQTVKFHRGNIMTKLHAKSLSELIRIAQRTGVIES